MTALEGRVALVTGAARGLGAEIVRRMVAAGALVTAADKRADDGAAADLVVWLASDRASYCTGGDYAADGGLGAGTPAPAD